VIGIDIGTTNVKAAAFQAHGELVSLRTQRVPLQVTTPGRAEQDPRRVVNAVLACIRDVVGVARRKGFSAEALALSGAMHSIVGLDEAGKPRTNVLTWADERGGPEAASLTASVGAEDFRRRAGVALTGSLPVSKLAWIRSNEPDIWSSVTRWVSVKELLFAELTGRFLVDPATAAASGLLDVRSGTWAKEMLALLELTPASLSDVVGPEEQAPILHPKAAGLGLEEIPVFVGSSDGVLSNLGSGVVSPGIAVWSLGTSGAIRALHPRYIAEGPRTFCYPGWDGTWVTGSAVNNGGAVLDWMIGAAFPDLLDKAAADGDVTERVLFDDLAAQAPAGSDGILFLPRLLKERSEPLGSPSGAILDGLRADHGRPHIARSCLEGIVLNMAGAFDDLVASTEVIEVRVTGGFTRSRLWCQILADVLQHAVVVPPMPHAPALGAAMLALSALGQGTVEELAEGLPPSSVVEPNPAHGRIYREARARFQALYDRSSSDA
jgi:gluconokinase